MKHLQTFEHFNPHPESDPNPVKQNATDHDSRKKVKTKEEAQKEEEEAVEAVAAGYISTNSSGS